MYLCVCVFPQRVRRFEVSARDRARKNGNDAPPPATSTQLAPRLGLPSLAHLARGVGPAPHHEAVLPRHARVPQARVVVAPHRVHVQAGQARKRRQRLLPQQALRLGRELLHGLAGQEVGGLDLQPRAHAVLHQAQAQDVGLGWRGFVALWGRCLRVGRLESAGAARFGVTARARAQRAYVCSAHGEEPSPHLLLRPPWRRREVPAVLFLRARGLKGVGERRQGGARARVGGVALVVGVVLSCWL